ncbi:MAG TPA: hypothetical protein VFC74_06960 [Oscillospiraceae bacterium]|nr:hypothetical protein [Oscillospiraceae bacterium]
MNKSERDSMNEANELSRLMKAMTKQMQSDNDRYEENPDADFNISNITITVGDETIRLVLGGPQAAGIHSMIQHIASENMYCVDFDRDEVHDYCSK